MNYQDQLYTPKLQYLIDNGYQTLLINGLKGIEKESLRISNDGLVSQMNHPTALGAALTHPYITTDYSEALLEFITPPFKDIKDTLLFLEEIHQFVYDNIDKEILLVNSMPCGINGDKTIRIAEYGRSNIGRMKHVYRQGLWHRYGRAMQAIAGVHFNYSIAEALWLVLHKQSQTSKNMQDFISDAYFGLIRNFQRQGWVLLYLFGASPATDKKYFKECPHKLAKQFDTLDENTLYLPYATSLRMSEVGYQSKNQENLKINYNSLAGYVKSLRSAIETPCGEYQNIGGKSDDEYLQLNSNILQIENEYYSSIRPKQIPLSGEKPTLALNKRGVRYIEVRSIDLDPFSPIGFDEPKGRFLEAFLLHCLMQESPLQSEQESEINMANHLLVANQGRKPGLKLYDNEQSINLNDWAQQILQSMKPICNILDQNILGKPYTKALKQQFDRVENSELTDSAKVLAEIKMSQNSFKKFAINLSEKHRLKFKKKN